MGSNPDILAYNLFVYCGNNPVIRYDVGGMCWDTILSVILHSGNMILIEIGIDTAAIGAFFLMMEDNGSGVYHAEFDCWQQYAGYNVLYDFVFDLGTCMVSIAFPFSYDGIDYTIWAWKGDYINMGAGAELGIYRGDSGHRTVDKSLAMMMRLIISYNGKCIADYFPSEKQWWITAFNPDYQNIHSENLSVTIGIVFNDSGMFKAFKQNFIRDSRWTFYTCSNMAILQF